MAKDYNPFTREAANDLHSLQIIAGELGCPPSEVVTAAAINRLAASQKQLAGVIDEGFKELTSAVYKLKASYDYERKKQQQRYDSERKRATDAPDASRDRASAARAKERSRRPVDGARSDSGGDRATPEGN